MKPKGKSSEFFTEEEGFHTKHVNIEFGIKSFFFGASFAMQVVNPKRKSSEFFTDEERFHTKHVILILVKK